MLQDQDQYVQRFSDFVSAAPSSYHAAHEAAAQLRAAGFVQHHEDAAWPSVDEESKGYVIRDGAIIAWRTGAGVSALSPFRIAGSHTDSPGFMLKPQPDFRTEGWAQVGVEVYGGPLLNSWLDRDLLLAGRVVTVDGVEYLTRTGAIARIPQLAVHLDRDANNGLKLDRQRHTQPIIGTGTQSIVDVLAEAAGLPASRIAGWDIRLADAQTPSRIGVAGELLASPRLDNLTSVFASLAALIGAEPEPGTIAMLAAFDHEELGSATRSGAAGPFLEDVLKRIQKGLGASVDAAAQAIAGSWCVSADAGHAVHPNYTEKHDPRVRPHAGEGALLKINANQRYATDAHGAALWHRACAAAGVKSQPFVSNNDVPCGSTIGPITATRLGMRTVDVGVPLLSMHSARELVHVDDLHALAVTLGSFFSGA